MQQVLVQEVVELAPALMVRKVGPEELALEVLEMLEARPTVQGVRKVSAKQCLVEHLEEWVVWESAPVVAEAEVAEVLEIWVVVVVE